MTIWTFNQSGTYPGAKENFAGVRVEVDDATNEVLSITPLTVHSEFEPAVEDVAPATVETDATASEEAQP